MVAIPNVSSTPNYSEASQLIGTLNFALQSIISPLLAPAGAGSMAGAIVLPAASSQVNLLSITGGATGSPVLVSVGGPSAGTNVNLLLQAKGTGAIAAGGATGSTDGATLLIATVASQVNGLSVTAAVSGSDPALAAIGSGSHINLTLTPKGTGTIKFGSTGVIAANGTVAATFTATSAPTGASTSIQRWLQFIDSTGRAGYIAVF